MIGVEKRRVTRGGKYHFQKGGINIIFGPKYRPLTYGRQRSVTLFCTVPSYLDYLVVGTKPTFSVPSGKIFFFGPRGRTVIYSPSTHFSFMFPLLHSFLIIFSFYITHFFSFPSSQCCRAGTNYTNLLFRKLRIRSCLLKRIFETAKYRKCFSKGDTCSVIVLIIILSYLHILAVFKNKGKLFGP